jgi:hypothetical protein
MANIEQLRYWQQERLVPLLALWNDAKKNLENAITLAEIREREFREVSEDVQRKLEAIDLVATMARELEGAHPGALDSPSDERQSRLIAPQGAGLKQLLTGLGKSEASPGPESTEWVPAARVSTGDSSSTVLHRSSRPLFSFTRRSRVSRLSILQ